MKAPDRVPVLALGLVVKVHELVIPGLAEKDDVLFLPLPPSLLLSFCFRVHSLSWSGFMIPFHTVVFFFLFLFFFCFLFFLLRFCETIVLVLRPRHSRPFLGVTSNEHACPFLNSS